MQLKGEVSRLCRRKASDTSGRLSATGDGGPHLLTWLACCLGRFAACQGLESRMLWKDCWGLSGPQTTMPCYSSMWYQWNFQRRPETQQTWLQGTGGEGEGHGGPGGFLLDPGSDGEELEEKWMLAVVQQLFVQLVSRAEVGSRTARKRQDLPV